MSVLEPLKISKINLDNIIYTKTKYSDDRKKKILYIKYSDEKNNIKNFVFQTPTLLSNKKPILNNDYYEMEIPLITKKEKNNESFINFLNKLDEKILYDAKINSNTWFDIVTGNNIFRQRIVRDSTEDNNSFIKLKIVNTRYFKTILKMNQNDNINIDEIPQFSWVKMILECYAITISNYGISLFIRPIIMSFRERISNNYNYKFIKDSESDDDENDTNFETKNIFISKEDTEENDKVNYEADENLKEEINDQLDDEEGNNKTGDDFNNENFEHINNESDEDINNETDEDINNESDEDINDESEIISNLFNNNKNNLEHKNSSKTSSEN